MACTLWSSVSEMSLASDELRRLPFCLDDDDDNAEQYMNTDKYYYYFIIIIIIISISIFTFYCR